MSGPRTPSNWQENRRLHVGFAALFPLAVLGFIAGVEAPDRKETPPNGQGKAEPAQNYLEQRLRSRGENSNTYVNGLGPLRPELTLSEVTGQTKADREDALRERADRRAYDGAPPVIPHGIDERSRPDCAECHSAGKNVRLGNKLAPTMSHAPYESCTQCHAPSRNPTELLKPTVNPENSFEGRRSHPGDRAWIGAPPVIPHTTWMRSDCSSCHGPAGAFGLRSTHPARTSCTQCHVPSADLDQRIAHGKEAE